MAIVKPIESREMWDEFLHAAQPNTFLHSWAWGEFQQGSGEPAQISAQQKFQSGKGIWRLGIYDGNILQGIALIIKVTAKRGSFLFCPHGPIVDRIMNYELVIMALVEHLKKLARDEHCSFVRFSPLMLKTSGHDKLWRDLGFRSAPTHMHPELAWILDIISPEDELLKGMRKTTRYSIRKAEKDGVRVMQSINPDDIEKFWEVYQSTVDRQHFVPFSKNYLRKEFEIFVAQNKAMFFFGIYKEEIISAAYVIFEQWSGFYHHGASIPKYTNIPASQLVQWHAILEAKRRGCKKYNFWGVVPETAVKHPWQGLSRFKRGFGGHTEAYVHAVDLPLSWNYWLTYAIERVRKWKRRL